jgi:hypothetical protein
MVYKKLKMREIQAAARAKFSFPVRALAGI